MTAKISSFIIIMILMSMVVAGGFVTLMASISENYNPGGYEEGNLTVYNKLAQIQNQTEEIENKTTSLQGSEAGTQDILGGFFEAGYNAMALSFSSFGIFEDMASAAREDIPYLDNIGIYYVGLLMIVTIILVFIILRVVVKGDI